MRKAAREKAKLGITKVGNTKATLDSQIKKEYSQMKKTGNYSMNVPSSISSALSKNLSSKNGSGKMMGGSVGSVRVAKKRKLVGTRMA